MGAVHGALQVEARQLRPPELVYKDMGFRTKILTAGTGEWNLRNLKFHAPAELGAFAVVSFHRQNGEAGGGPDSPTSVLVRAPSSRPPGLYRPPNSALISQSRLIEHQAPWVCQHCRFLEGKGLRIYHSR